MPRKLFLNGIDADTGSYIIEDISSDMIAKIARGQKLDASEIKDIKVRSMLDKLKTGHLGVVEGIDATDISQAGWSVVFPANMPQKTLEATKEALAPLLEHRKAQARKLKEHHYREVSGGDGYQPGETKTEFLARFERGPGPADPNKFPYYVLIVGDPETIPFSFQYQLDIQYAVGRIHFDEPEKYYQYATSVVQAEKSSPAPIRKAAFWGVANPDDAATGTCSEHLVKPLAEGLKASYPGWEIEHINPDEATKANLASYLGGSKKPDLLFSACHGVRFNPGDPRQITRQGALVCQDWPGPKARIPIKEKYYFSADDLDVNADVAGMFVFLFACYGGGTPKIDNFYHQAYGVPQKIAPQAFLAQLPLKLLSHPRGGALAVFAHVERSWTTSIIWKGTVRDVDTFASTLRALCNGKPAGNAMEYLNSRYAEISSDLTAELEVSTPRFQDDIKIAGLWTSNNDARNYTLIGDPAARLVSAST